MTLRGHAMGAVLCALGLMIGLVSNGCATNPATGKTQIMLISEGQEIEMGRQADQEVVESMGLYDDPELQDYVQELGESLAATSERPHLPWTFRVIDDPVVNAFALPGGFIYITRGIMAHLNSEAELVTVLGHEIGHVTARHSANQLSKAQLASVGLAVGTAIEPGLAGFGELAGTGLGLMFLKFSRDDERQADDLGLRYMIKADYDARQGPGVFSMLQKVGETSGGGRVPGWLSTHPAPENRVARMETSLAGMGPELEGKKILRVPYLRRLDGMVFGANPREGYFENNRFLHPDMEFRLEFPADWEAKNQRQAVLAVSSQEDAVILLTLASDRDPQTAARKFLAQEGIRAGTAESVKINNLPAVWARFEFENGANDLAGRVVFVQHRERTFRMVGYTYANRWSQYSRTLDQSLQSFARLRDRQALAVQPARLRLDELNSTMTLEGFDQQFPSSVSLQVLGLINHTELDSELPQGTLVKRVIGGPENRD